MGQRSTFYITIAILLVVMRVTEALVADAGGHPALVSALGDICGVGFVVGLAIFIAGEVF